MEKKTKTLRFIPRLSFVEKKWIKDNFVDEEEYRWLKCYMDERNFIELSQNEYEAIRYFNLSIYDKHPYRKISEVKNINLIL